MPAIDTGKPGIDAIDNLAAHLDAAKATIGYGHVYDHPAHELGKRGPAVSLELESVAGTLQEVSAPTVHVDWTITVRVWFFTNFTQWENAYREVVAKMSAIMVHLVTNNRPNGYGDTLIDASGFGPSIGLVPTQDASRQLFGGNILVTIVYTGAHTLV